MSFKNVIIEVDPGVDDALAVFMLSQAKNIKVRLMVAGAGNIGAEVSNQNCLYLKNRFRMPCRVVKGSKKPFVRKIVKSLSVHGKSGLGAFKFNEKFESKEVDFCQSIKSVLDKFSDVTYVVLSPITNLAIFLDKNPEYAKKIKEVVFMGGVKDEVDESNFYDEFNVGCDPEAVEKILSLNVKLTLVPSELGHFNFFDKEDVERIKNTNRLGADFAKMFDGYFDRVVGKTLVATHDACVAAYVINKKFFKAVPAKVYVKYLGENKVGCLINEIYDVKNPNAKLVLDLDRNKFKELFFLFLKNFEE